MAELSSTRIFGDLRVLGRAIVKEPQEDNEAATKQYVDENGGGVALEISDTEPSDVEVLWVNDQEAAASPFPDGGATGAIIAKSSSADGDVDWSTLELPLAYDSGQKRIYLDMTELLNAQAPISFDPSTKQLSIDTSSLFNVVSPLAFNAGSGSISIDPSSLIYASYPLQYNSDTRTISIDTAALESHFENVFGHLEAEVNAAVALVDPKLEEVDQAIEAMEGAYLPSELLEIAAITTTSGSVNIDFNGAGYREQSITGNVNYSASNYIAGKTITVKIETDSEERDVTFNEDWKFMSEKPETIPADQTAILTITAFGTTASSCIAAWAVTE